jgi:hypothetical protein
MAALFVAAITGALLCFGNLISGRVRCYYSTKGVIMKDEGSQVAYRDNHGNIISGVVVGYDQYMRYMVRVSGSGKFDPLTIVSESNLVH